MKTKLPYILLFLVIAGLLIAWQLNKDDFVHKDSLLKEMENTIDSIETASKERELKLYDSIDGHIRYNEQQRSINDDQYRQLLKTRYALRKAKMDALRVDPDFRNNARIIAREARSTD